MEGDHRTKSANAKLFGLRKRLDLRNLSVLQHARRLYVLVDESFYGKHKLIFEWRLRLLRQTSHVELQGINQRLLAGRSAAARGLLFIAQTSHQVSGQNACHP